MNVAEKPQILKSLGSVVVRVLLQPQKCTLGTLAQVKAALISSSREQLLAMQQPFSEQFGKKNKAFSLCFWHEGISENRVLLGAAPMLRAFSCRGAVLQTSPLCLN